jgi:hypothetical protein
VVAEPSCVGGARGARGRVDAPDADVDVDVDALAEFVVGQPERFEHLQLGQFGFDQLDRLCVDANAALALADGRAGDGRLLLA